MAVFKVYGTGATAVWTLDAQGQPKLVALVDANKYIGIAKSQNTQDLLLTKTSPSGGWRYASPSEEHYNFGRLIKLDYAEERFVTTKAPNLIINGKQITPPKIVKEETGGGGNDGGSLVTDDSTENSEETSKPKSGLIIGGLFLLFLLFYKK